MEDIRDINSLNEDLKQKAVACKTPEELLALAEEEGVQLSKEELQAISGGGVEWSGGRCSANECMTEE